VPFVVWGFFKLITPFIDPLTREKLKFNEDMAQHVPPSQLLKQNGGEVDFEYDHSVYWPSFIKLAETRRAAYRARWEKAGKPVGESEDHLTGGSTGSLFEKELDVHTTNESAQQ
jgi:CRAL/TRIO domain